MKPIILSLIIALFLSGCPQQPIPVEQTSPPSSPATMPIDSDNPQQALVIGHSDYEYSPLTDSVNEAKLMDNQLTQMGFSVNYQTNLTLQAMTTAIEQFSQRLSNHSAPDSVGLFYFSGHGSQYNEQNFLLPINNDKIQTEQDFEQHALSASRVIDSMANAHSGMNIIILDACHSKPYRHSNNNPNPGLTRIVPPRGTLIAFAAEENQTVSAHNFYTKTLVSVLEQATHQRIEDVFMEVGEQVKQQSNGNQLPWYQASLRKAFCFGGCLSRTPESKL